MIFQISCSMYSRMVIRLYGIRFTLNLPHSTDPARRAGPYVGVTDGKLRSRSMCPYS